MFQRYEPRIGNPKSAWCVLSELAAQEDLCLMVKNSSRPSFRFPSESTVLWRQETRTRTQKSASCVLSELAAQDGQIFAPWSQAEFWVPIRVSCAMEAENSGRNPNSAWCVLSELPTQAGDLFARLVPGNTYLPLGRCLWCRLECKSHIPVIYSTAVKMRLIHLN